VFLSEVYNLEIRMRKMILAFVLFLISVHVASASNCVNQPIIVANSSTTWVKVLDYDAARKSLTVQNVGAAAVIVNWDEEPTGGDIDKGKVVAAGGAWEAPVGQVPVNEMWLKSESGTPEYRIDYCH
jgi:hypothetical protein